MIPNEQKVFVIKITLDDIKPDIWRIVEVPCYYTFYQLHLTIQAAMDGWLDYHLHEFITDLKGVEIRIVSPDDQYSDDEDETVDETQARIYSYILNCNKIKYKYDFGDRWVHNIELIGTKEPEKGKIYPRIIDGGRACPPEDCGGFPGYEDMLKALAGPDCPEKQELQRWLKKPFDPEYFNIKHVKVPKEIKTKYPK